MKKPGRHNIHWDPRMNTADNSPEMQESLLHLRRQLAGILQDPVLEQEQFLEMARASRKAGSARMAIAAWHVWRTSVSCSSQALFISDLIHQVS